MTSRIVFGVLGLTVLWTGPALADAIDGAWCRDGLQLMIDGPSIVTAGGAKTSGDYSRHAFSYVAPPSDPGPGTAISMRLLNEETMQLRPGATGAVETWRRCGPPVS